MKKARVIAFYLPQYHPIPENNEWWGKGFTEWTNVGKAKPLFKGHYQPKVPADLGYYDLRMPEIREAQAAMAKEAGVEGFMYWHYWFGNNKTLLERPFKEVLSSGKPDFPFCLGWANHSWYAKNWNAGGTKGKDKLLIEQTYPGEEDYRKHFETVLPAFKDKRYIMVENKPLFLVFAPLDCPDIKNFMNLWNLWARENALEGVFFVGCAHKNKDHEGLLNAGFDAVYRDVFYDATIKIKGKKRNKIMWELSKILNITPGKISYEKFINYSVDENLDSRNNVFPSIVPNFDHSPRSGNRGIILTNSTPELFKRLVKKVVNVVAKKKDSRKIIFLRSWNEWAEGNYVEPDLKFGHGYLDALKKEL